MIFKVNDIIYCMVETLKDGKKRIIGLNKSIDSILEEKSFLIIGLDKTLQTYKILLEDNFIGWNISEFHIKYQNVDRKFLGKKFYDVSESLINNI